MTIALNTLARKIAGCLLTEVGPVYVRDISAKIGCSDRMVRYELDTVSQWFETKDVTVFRFHDGKISIQADDNERAQLLAEVQNRAADHAILSPEERQYVLLGLFLSKGGGHTVDQLTRLLKVSRATLHKDLAEIRQKLRPYGLTLTSSPKHGYSITGPERKIRQTIADIASCPNQATHQVTQMSASQHPHTQFPTPVSGILDGILAALPVKDPREGYSFLHSLVSLAEDRLGTRFTDIARTSLITHLAITIGRVQDGDFITIEPTQLGAIKAEKHYETAKEICNRITARLGVTFPESEIGYVTLYLLGAKRAVPDRQVGRTQNALLNDLLQKMVAAAEESLGFSIADEELISGLSTHLLAVYYRVKYGLVIRNPLYREIKTSYPAFYEAAVRASEAFKENSGLSLPEEEIAYIAMHVGAAAVRSRPVSSRKKRVAIVCPNGVGTTSVLSAQLKARYPDVEIVGTYLVAEILRKVPDNIDAVISTVPLGLRNVPCAVVSPVLRFEDQMLIDDLLDLIPSTDTNLWSSTDKSPLSSPRLGRGAILFDVECSDWKDAVRVAGQVLVDKGFCEKRYVGAMIRQIEKYGCYAVFKGGLALPHAKPSDGVIRTGMSLVRLKNPVKFPGPGTEPVRTLLALACTEQLDPDKARRLNQLVLGNKSARLSAARTLDELIHLLGDLVEPGLDAALLYGGRDSIGKRDDCRSIRR